MSKCAKCKSTLSRVGDTWCLGCSGWESIGLELSSSWSTPGLRRIADDLVVQTARNLRALRARADTSKTEKVIPPARPVLPRPGRESVRPDRQLEAKPVVKEEARSPERDRSRGRRASDHRGRVDRAEVRRNRRKSEERDHRERSRRKKRKRGGRKHQRLARLEENPLLPHHRKLSSAFLDERVGLRD